MQSQIIVGSPRVVGTATWHDGYGVNTHAVQWVMNTGYSVVDYGTAFTPTGLGWQSTSGGQMRMVGSTSTQAKRVTFNGSTWNWVTLPHLVGGGSPSGAWGTDPGSTFTAGFGTKSSVQRPVVWTDADDPFDLIGTGYASAHGETRAVNGTRVAVGSVTGRFTISGSTPKRGFRTPGGSSFEALSTNDDLPPPSDKSATTPTAGAGIDSTGNAIGTYTDPSTMEVFALYWPARTGSANPAATHLGVWESSINGSLEDAESSATGVGITGITGKSRSSGGSDRAVYRNAYYLPWIDLNDRHYVHGTTGWSLKEATALNDTGVIVGNGTLSGANRGFILIPRTSGN